MKSFIGGAQIQLQYGAIVPFCLCVVIYGIAFEMRTRVKQLVAHIVQKKLCVSGSSVGSAARSTPGKDEGRVVFLFIQ